MSNYGLVKSAFSWPGNGRSILGGAAIIGPQFYRVVLTFSLISVPGGAFLAYPAWDVWRSTDSHWVFSIGCGLLSLTLVLEVLLALSNPGFIPCQNSLHSLGPIGAVPMILLKASPQKYLELPINGALIRLKYCHSCAVLRPPRTSHCRKCGVCVERFDHHCPWISKCIGKRNHLRFLAFILLLTGTEAYILSVCLENILIKIDHWAVHRIFHEKIAEIVIGCYSFFVFPT